MGLRNTGRPTQAIIDLDGLASNFHSAKQFIGLNLKYMAVVKADAYGHGAKSCALRLESESVDWFGVAIPEEGVELRRAGLKAPILCLGSFWPGQEAMLATHSLTPAIYTEREATILNEYGAENAIKLDVHVKVDTGMGRVGIRYDESKQFAEFISQLKYLEITGILTHFAAAENSNENAFTELQIGRFSAACQAFRDAGHTPELTSLANSPGAIAHPSSRGNMVRLGGALYGLLDDILSSDAGGPCLKPVMSLRSQIAHVKHVPRGESLGYGRTYRTTRDSLIALVPIGYADGYPRGLSNCGTACVKSRLVPIVGRISMDWTLLDVTDVVNPATDDEVILIGGGVGCVVSAADIAGHLGTIGYEITCGISPRVPRIYK